MFRSPCLRRDALAAAGHHTKKHQYDVCVIGAGPAGIAGALRALDYNRSVCIVEKDPERLGGADIWDGALQSKTLWEMSKTYRLMNGRTAQRFMRPTKAMPHPSFSRLRDSMKTAAVTRQAQIAAQLKFAQIPIIRGTAAFTDRHTLNITSSSPTLSQPTTITSDYFLIATGSEPREHPTIPFDGKVVLSSSDMLNITEFPKSVVIIGAGVIGCEFASILANFGQTRVHVIEKGDRILPMEDEDVSIFVQKLLEMKGVDFHHSSALVDGKADHTAPGGAFSYSLRNIRTGEISNHEVEKALVSIGRTPVLNNLQLSNIGISCGGAAAKLAIDAHRRVAPYPNIYAVGDATTSMMLVNVGEHEARKAVEHIYDTRDEAESTASPTTLSSIMFLDQEVASVGLNELQCQKRNISYRVASYSYKYVSRAVAMGNTRGFVKLIVTNDDRMMVLGLRAVGAHASSIVDLGSLAIHNKARAHQLAELLTAYPSMTQGFLECVRVMIGTSTLKPNTSPGITRRSWSPDGFGRGRAFQQEEVAGQQQQPSTKS